MRLKIRAQFHIQNLEDICMLKKSPPKTGSNGLADARRVDGLVEQ